MRLLPENFSDLPDTVKLSGLLDETGYAALRNLVLPRAQPVEGSREYCPSKISPAQKLASAPPDFRPPSYVSISPHLKSSLYIVGPGSTPQQRSTDTFEGGYFLSLGKIASGSNAKIKTVLNLITGHIYCLKIDKDKSNLGLQSNPLSYILEPNLLRALGRSPVSFILTNTHCGTESKLYILMDFIEGSTFKQFIISHAPLSLKAMVSKPPENTDAEITSQQKENILLYINIAYEIIRAVYCLNKQYGVFHGDIHVGNIMVTPPYSFGQVTVTLIDFGNSIATNITTTHLLGYENAPEILQQNYANLSNRTSFPLPYSTASEAYTVGKLLKLLFASLSPYTSTPAISDTLSNILSDLDNITEKLLLDDPNARLTLKEAGKAMNNVSTRLQAMNVQAPPCTPQYNLHRLASTSEQHVNEQPPKNKEHDPNGQRLKTPSINPFKHPRQ